MWYSRSMRGFTLIELLVVVSIISIMLAISFGTFSNLQKNSHDAKRKSDFSLIQSALEQYHADQHNYPVAESVGFGGDIGIGTTYSLTSPDSSKTYLKKIPADATYTYHYQPLPDSCDNSTLDKSCTKYCLYTNMENSSNGTTVSDCTLTGYTYAVTSP